MGGVFSIFNENDEFIKKSRPLKRKFCENNENGQPSFKFKMDTSYFYKTFFEEGKGSDITIIALGQKWKLHKMYLVKSPYFYAMLGGDWIESKLDEIRIDIVDNQITKEALHKVFGSFYSEDIEVNPQNAISILACASFLQMDCIQEKCIYVIKSSLCANNVLFFYEKTEIYGCTEIRDAAFQWLLLNIMTKFRQPSQLRKISIDLMLKLISSPQLIAFQAEFCVYIFLKMWVYSNENISLDTCDTPFIDLYNKYFAKSVDKKPFLDTSAGVKYQKVFKALRLPYLVCNHLDFSTLKKDNIIPPYWFNDVYQHLWQKTVELHKGIDFGPVNVSSEDFYKNCMRFSRILKAERQYTWRWTGYLFGLDLVISYRKGIVYLKRNVPGNATTTHNAYQNRLIDRAEKRHIMYTFNVYSLNDNGIIIHSKESGISKITLREEEEVPVLDCKKNFTFPLIISANFLLTTPIQVINSNLSSRFERNNSLEEEI